MVWFYHVISLFSVFKKKHFQSHYGLILSYQLPLREVQVLLTFNPTMVWFYRNVSLHDLSDHSSLSIPLWSDFIDATYRIVDIDYLSAFNPTMVWFYQNFIQEMPTYEQVLSIPLWSDFITDGWIGKQIILKTFNPTMVWFYLVYRLNIERVSRPQALSIPLWSDFIVKQCIHHLLLKFLLSIPLWSDFIRFFYNYLFLLSCLLSIPLWSDFIFQVCRQERANLRFQSHYGLILS